MEQEPGQDDAGATSPRLPRRPAGPQHDEPGDLHWDVALARLEDFLLAYPLDRALPDVTEIVREADLPVDFLAQDERASKVLHEAIHARPFSTPAEVADVRAEVEMLTLEAQVIADRLRDPGTAAVDRGGAQERLGRLRRRLEEIRRQL